MRYALSRRFEKEATVGGSRGERVISARILSTEKLVVVADLTERGPISI